MSRHLDEVCGAVPTVSMKEKRTEPKMERFAKNYTWSIILHSLVLFNLNDSRKLMFLRFTDDETEAQRSKGLIQNVGPDPEADEAFSL